MEVRRYSSGPEMLADAGPMLAEREAESSLLIGLAEAQSACAGCELALAAFSGGRPVGALVQTVINEAVITARGPGPAWALGEALAGAGTRSRGVVGIAPESQAAAEAFAACAGVAVRLERALTLHRLGREPDGGDADGVLRPACDADGPLLTAWASGFENDTRMPGHGRNADRVRQGIDSGRLFVLVSGGEAVAAASWGRPTAHTRTITCVYTPPGERGRGRGRAVTALLARRLLDDGARDVLLFTDSDDPTPNRVYARVGFAPLASFMHQEFVWPGAAPAAGSL